MGYKTDPTTGARIYSPTHGYYDEDAHFEGFLISASGIDNDTIYDHLITSEVYVHGGYFWTTGGNIGDYGEFSVVDKDDVLGLFSLYGLTQGVDVLELGKHVSHQYINPDGMNWAQLQPPTVAVVASGLYLRTKLHTTSDAQIHMGVTYLWFEV